MEENERAKVNSQNLMEKVVQKGFGEDVFQLGIRRVKGLTNESQGMERSQQRKAQNLLWELVGSKKQKAKPEFRRGTEKRPLGIQSRAFPSTRVQ